MTAALTRLSPMAKVLGWYSVVNSVLTVVAVSALPRISGQPISMFAFVLIGTLGLATLVGGYFGLKGNAWAFWLLFAVFLVQSIEYFSETFFFSFIGPLAIKVGWGWYSPPSRLNVNLLAVATCAMSFIAARGLTPGGTDGP